MTLSGSHHVFENKTDNGIIHHVIDSKGDSLERPVDQWWALARILAPGIEPGGGPYVWGYEWCAGFYRGFHLRSEAWKPLRKDREHAQLLMPIFWFINEDLRRETCAGRDPEAVRHAMLLAVAASVKAINIYRRMKEENARQEILDRFDDQCRQIPCQNTPPGKERQRALAEFEKAGGRRTPRGAKSRKARRERVLNTALETVSKALGGGRNGARQQAGQTPPKLTSEAFWLPKAATSVESLLRKPQVGQDDLCPCEAEECSRNAASL